MQAGVQALMARWGRHWGWFAFFGMVSLAVGVIALSWPGATLVVLGVAFGIQLVVSGIFRMAEAALVKSSEGGGRALMAILGLLGLLIGLYALRHVEITVIALGLVLGIYWVIDGVAELFRAINQPELHGRAWVAVSGVLAAFAGIILLSWPGLSLLVLATIVGIWLLFFGGLQLMIASRLYSLTRH